MKEKKRKKDLDVSPLCPHTFTVHLRAQWVVLYVVGFSYYSAVLSLLVKYKDPPVACAVRAGVVHPYDDEDMLKVRANGLGGEGVSAGLLEHDGHYVVPYVALPQQLVIEKQQSLNYRSMGFESESIWYIPFIASQKHGTWKQ